MKRMIALMVISIATLITCTSPENTPECEIDYTCEFPSDQPDTLSTGEKIYWDCDWEASYKADNVKFIKNEDGEITMVIRSTSR